jgi:hypothetical protein
MRDHDALDFAELAATLQSAPTPTETAEDIVRYVQTQLDADQAAISIIRTRNKLETIAPTDPAPNSSTSCNPNSAKAHATATAGRARP